MMTQCECNRPVLVIGVLMAKKKYVSYKKYLKTKEKVFKLREKVLSKSWAD